MDELCESAVLCRPEISKWSVGQHIEHCLIAISGMALALKKQHPGSGSRGPNEYRDLVMETKKFPRGVVEAPAISHPGENRSVAFLHSLILKTRNRLGDPLSLAETSSIIHPIMNVMYRDEVLEFMTIHTAHHLLIIDEIMTSAT